ncbi:MAG: hypothetical protein ACRDPD_18300 [Streptosporangiaceae bacterium]
MATYTMHELELETAELLPARETLWCCRYGSTGSSHVTTTNIDSGNGSFDGNNNGNAGGFLSPSILSGNLNGDLDGNTIVL